MKMRLTFCFSKSYLCSVTFVFSFCFLDELSNNWVLPSEIQSTRDFFRFSCRVCCCMCIAHCILYFANVLLTRAPQNRYTKSIGHTKTWIGVFYSQFDSAESFQQSNCIYLNHVTSFAPLCVVRDLVYLRARRCLCAFVVARCSSSIVCIIMYMTLVHGRVISISGLRPNSGVIVCFTNNALCLSSCLWIMTSDKLVSFYSLSLAFAQQHTFASAARQSWYILQIVHRVS